MINTGHRSEDFLLIEKCFASIKAREDIKNSLAKISTVLKRAFDLNFTISLIDNDTNKFFGMTIYPSKNTIDSMVSAMVAEKSQTSVIIDIWQKNVDWFLEIDSILLYDKNLNANPSEITAVLLHEIGHIVVSNSIPQRVNKVIRYKLMRVDYSIKKLCEHPKIRSLFEVVVVDACASKNYHYINKEQEREADKFVIRMGYASELDNFITKLINSQGNRLVNRTSDEMEGDVRTIVNWTIDNISELEFRKNKLKQSIQTEILKNPSLFVRAIFDGIKHKFFGSDKDSYKSLISEQYLVDLKHKIVKESILNWFDNLGKIKKVNQSEIDIINIEIDKISNSDDKIYVLDLIYDKLELVTTALEYLSKGQQDKVQQSKQTLTGFKDRLEKMRERVLSIQIKDKQYGVFIKYPKGYEG